MIAGVRGVIARGVGEEQVRSAHDPAGRRGVEERTAAWACEREREIGDSRHCLGELGNGRDITHAAVHGGQERAAAAGV